MKPFYRKKGKYADNRIRIVIEDRDTKKSIALPKPEILMRHLERINLGTPNNPNKVSKDNT